MDDSVQASRLENLLLSGEGSAAGLEDKRKASKKKNSSDSKEFRQTFG